jgi:ribosomal-protein-alanine N-acetyltransferase
MNAVKQHTQILATDKKHTTVRPLTPADIPAVQKMIESAWRVSIQLPTQELTSRLTSLPGLLAEDSVGLRGFMVLEPHLPHFGFLAGVGLRDTWHITPFLDSLLPRLEQTARTHALSNLVYIGQTTWLTKELVQRDFSPQTWVITLQRSAGTAPLTGPTPTQLRPARSADVPAITALDAAAFDHIWHKAIGQLTGAIRYADIFEVAEIDGLPVGYVWAEVYMQQLHLTRLAVLPNYQGLGIGTQMIRRVINVAQQRGLKKISLNTQTDNQRSLALYYRFGFKTTRQKVPMLLKKLGYPLINPQRG